MKEKEPLSNTPWFKQPGTIDNIQSVSPKISDLY